MEWGGGSVWDKWNGYKDLWCREVEKEFITESRLWI